MEKSKRSFEDLQREIEDNDESFSQLYRISSIIGQGAFGVVCSCLELETNMNYAVKIVVKKSFNSADLNKLRYEAETLSLLSHPNIVKYKNETMDSKRVETEGKMFMVMEHIRWGSLRKLIEERKTQNKEISDLEASTIMCAILKAVFYIHSNNIVHRDLKPDPENILIDDISDLSSVKLTDFGLSVQFGREFISRQLTQSCGTLVFMAPELAFHHPYSMTVDMWSCGIILYLILNRNQHPLYRPDDTHDEYMEKLEHPNWEFPSSFSKYAIDLFLRLVKQDPSERYRAEEALKHPWITRKKNVIPQTISEKRKTFYLQVTMTNIISACMVISLIRKKMNDLPKIPISYIQLLEKNNQIAEFKRLEIKSLSAISPHSPNQNHDYSPHEEIKDLTLSMTKVENEGNKASMEKKQQGFTEIYLKKLESSDTNTKKTLHIKHDSYGGIPPKISPKKDLKLTIDKGQPGLESRSKTSKTFYSPQKKIETSPKKLSVSSKEGSTNNTSRIKLEKVGTPLKSPKKK